MTNKKINKKQVVEEYQKFEKFMLEEPRTFFSLFEASSDCRRKIIWKEYLDWQQNGGKTKDIKFRDIASIGIGNIGFRWQLGNEHFAQAIDKFAPFTKEEYQKALSAVYSYMNDRPQYFKFRKLEGMFNPLSILLLEILSPYIKRTI